MPQHAATWRNKCFRFSTFVKSFSLQKTRQAPATLTIADRVEEPFRVCSRARQMRLWAKLWKIMTWWHDDMTWQFVSEILGFVCCFLQNLRRTANRRLSAWSTCCRCWRVWHSSWCPRSTDAALRQCRTSRPRLARTGLVAVRDQYTDSEYWLDYIFLYISILMIWWFQIYNLNNY